jgi:hypothetical protein
LQVFVLKIGSDKHVIFILSLQTFSSLCPICHLSSCRVGVEEDVEMKQIKEPKEVTINVKT